MFGGGGGMNPRKMQQMMEQMGIDVTEIDAEEVIIKTADEELVFDGAEVTRMDVRGEQTYQVVGEAQSRPRSGDVNTETETTGAIDPADVEIVAQRAGVSEADAKAALEATDGDLAAAIDRLE